MGSAISYKVNFEGRGLQNKHNQRRKRRRDSASRPVLKLQIYSESMERYHITNGESSLDLPFFKRLSSQKFSATDLPLDSHSIHSNVFDSFNPPLNYNGKNLSLRAKESAPVSTSKIVVQFVDNQKKIASLNAGGSTSSLPAVDTSTTPPKDTEEERQCLMEYDVSAKESADIEQVTSISRDEYEETTHPYIDFDKKHQQQQQQQSKEQCPVNNNKHVLNRQRSRSFDNILDLQKQHQTLCHKASINISRKVTHTASLNGSSTDIDIQVMLNDGDWSFGENIIKSLEAEGILLFNMENPQTTSEFEVSQTWPELKDKLKKWRSEECLEL